MNELHENLIPYNGRKQAIGDGILIDVIDVTETAKEVGFKFPVAVSNAVWERYILPSKRDAQAGQEKEDRLWATLWMLLLTIKSGKNGNQLNYEMLYIMEGRPLSIELKALAGPGDDYPVLTIMLTNEA